MKLYRNWIINEVARAMTKGEHMNVRTYIRTGQTLYPLHNFVVRGDNYHGSGRTHRNYTDFYPTFRRELPHLKNSPNYVNQLYKLCCKMGFSHLEQYKHQDLDTVFRICYLNCKISLKHTSVLRSSHQMSD